MVSKRRKSSGINAILQRKLGCSLDINEIDKSDLNNVSKFFLLSFNFVSNYLKKKIWLELMNCQIRIHRKRKKNRNRSDNRLRHGYQQSEKNLRIFSENNFAGIFNESFIPYLDHITFTLIKSRSAVQGLTFRRPYRRSPIFSVLGN